MNRRSFLRAAGATGLLLMMQGPAAGSIFGSKPSMEALIRQALAERRLVKFKYHGHSRVAEPHALGHVTEGRLALLGWQVSGGSASEPPPGWRTFVLAEIQSLKLLRKNYVPRPDYRPETSKLKPLTAEVVAEPKSSP
jgi:predicted DNA-binding transcriptional regulator YafY